MTILLKSNRLAHVSYEIRGEVMSQAKKMEEEGHSITKLNIGNTISPLDVYTKYFYTYFF